MRLRGTLCASAVVMLLGSTLTEGAEIATGSITVVAGQQVRCIAPNVGPGKIGHVHVRFTFNKAFGTTTGFGDRDCTDLAPRDACDAGDNGIAGDASVFCEITYSNGKMRGTLCNDVTGMCADAR